MSYFGVVYIQIFCPYLFGFVVLLLSCNSSLFILRIVKFPYLIYAHSVLTLPRPKKPLLPPLFPFTQWWPMVATTHQLLCEIPNLVKGGLGLSVQNV